VRWLLIGFAVVFLALAAWLWGPLAPYKARWRQSCEEAASFDVLARAASPSELKETVGSLGLFMRYPDGSWMAVRYRDSHLYPGWSSAVVRDSGGAWFTSEEHFCGKFELYRHCTQQGRELLPSLEPVRELAEAKTLTVARDRLLALGFREVEPPSK
jgi:hypothetical protein